MSTIDMTAQPIFPARVILDTEASTPVQGIDANTSRIVSAPFHVQVETIPVGTSAILQGKTHPDASWMDLISFTNTNTPFLHTFAVRLNFVRVVRSGSGAYSQG